MKLAGLPRDKAKKKVFPFSLKVKALAWYRLCDDIGAWNWNRSKLEFHQKNYPMHLVHRDRNYIYNFWPCEGESIALAWGRLKSMLHSCPNYELSGEIIIQNFYARLSRDDISMLDTSGTGSFMKKVFPLYLKGKALEWYRICDDIGSWNWNRFKLEFHQKIYPMHLVHRDRKYIYI